MRVFFDTSVLVPAVVDQLANHEAAFEAFLNHTASPHRAYCSTHALAECYATMTAVPLPRRILPGEARQLVQESILGRVAAVPLTAADYARALTRVADGGLTSGAVYDALHVCCAERMSIDRILTYNVRDFERCRPRGPVVTAP